jgi:hypothetical protein
MRTALFWIFTQRVVAISYGRFGKKHIGSIFRGQDAKRRGFLNPEEEADRLSRNICNKLPLLSV